MTALAPDDRSARRFTHVFLAVVFLGLLLSIAMALAIDPTRTFGTGLVPSALTAERDTKPIAFRTIEPPPRAVVLGSSRVLKLRPACIEELTGLPAFNFGLSLAVVDDLVASFRFIRARGRAPIRELIIGIDVEAFDLHAETDQRLLSSVELRPYMDGTAGLSFDTATRALFGWQALRFAASSLWYHLNPGARPRARMSYSRDGFITYDVMEAQIRAGTFSPQKTYADVAAKLEGRRSSKDYLELAAPRVAQFRAMISAAHADGTSVDVFIPPIARALESARDHGQLAARTRDLDALLADLERAGLVHYLRIARVEDVGGDPAGYFDGVHMTEANSSRVLLAMFHRSHGCGI